MNTLDMYFDTGKELPRKIQNYPSPLVDSKKFRRMKLIELCNTILYSNNIQRVNECYNILFTEYSRDIENNTLPAVSCFEDVVVKLLNDADNGTLMTRYGVQYNPFMRFVAICRNIEKQNKAKDELRRRCSSISSIKGNNEKDKKRSASYQSRESIKYYLMLFIERKTTKIENDFIRDLIHKYFKNLDETEDIEQ